MRTLTFLATAVLSLAGTHGAAGQTGAPGKPAGTPGLSPASKNPLRTPQPAIPVLAFTLSPLERSGGEENHVVIPEGMYTIRLRLDLEDCGTRALRATIQTAEGVAVARLDGLKARSIESGACAVFVDLPSARFRGGHYTVRLNRVAADGTAEVVEGYTFRVEHARHAKSR